MGYEWLYFIGAIVLLAALGYGVYRDKTRDRRKDALTDAATREQYRHPERYQQTQKAFEDAAKD
jgi:hypothetical protein